jgi:hypothetical protein
VALLKPELKVGDVKNVLPSSSQDELLLRAVKDARSRLEASFKARGANAKPIAVGHAEDGTLVFSTNDPAANKIVYSLAQDYGGIATMWKGASHTNYAGVRFGHAESTMMWTTPGLKSVGATLSVCADSCQPQALWFGVRLVGKVQPCPCPK